jgi:hypothetical protein
MSPLVKFLIGLVAALLSGWAFHGPLGAGETFIGSLEGQAREAVAGADLPGVTVNMERRPLSRAAWMSGAADQFQREGMGSLKGLNDRVGEIDGITKVRWTDEPDRGGFTLPLLAEALLAVIAAYLIAVGFGWLLFGRRRRGYV